MPLLRTMARTAVIAGTATSVSGRVARRQQGRWAEQQAAPPPQPAPAAPAAPAEPDYMVELRELARLREAGIVTPDEFDAKKRQLLGI